VLNAADLLLRGACVIVCLVLPCTWYRLVVLGQHDWYGRFILFATR